MRSVSPVALERMLGGVNRGSNFGELVCRRSDHKGFVESVWKMGEMVVMG